MAIFGTLIALAFAFQTAAPTGASSPERQTPAQARWEVDYGSTECRLIRHFSETGQPYRLTISRDWTFGGYQWALYGSALPLHSSMKTIEIALGQDDARHFKFESYAVTKGEARLAWHDPDGLLFNHMREGDRLHLTAARNLDLTLELKNIAEATKSLEKCEDDLWAGWGFDAQQIRSLSKRAEPSNNVSQWATTNDYPRADFVNKNEGTTAFLLNVDARGAATQCHIIASSGFQTLDKQTCMLALARAAFTPARDAEGKAVAGFFISLVRWRVSR